MIGSVLTCLFCIFGSADDIHGNLLGRSLTWDPQGLVPFAVGYSLTDMDKGWIASMRKGDYAKVSAAAKNQCLKKPSFFAIWVIAESARVRKDLSDFYALESELKSAGADGSYTSYATYRLLSLKLAQTPWGRKEGKMAIQNPDYPPLVAKTEEAWQACLPYASKHLPVAVALATGNGTPNVIREFALKAFDASTDKNSLLLWKARAQMLGKWSVSFSIKSGQPDRNSKGQVAYYFREGNEPDLAGAEATLKQFRTKYPGDPKYLYYHARLLCWTAFFFTTKENEQKRKTDLAVAEMRKFLEAADQPPPLVESGKKFLQKPDPGAFNTPPLE